MIILGIDPGYQRCGWGVLEKGINTSFVACGLIEIKTNTSADIVSDAVMRLSQLQSQLQAVLVTHTPDIVAIESIFFSNNAKTVIGVAQARGVILASIGSIPQTPRVMEYTPNQIKSAVTGSGSADKKSVEKMMRLQLAGIPENTIDDTIDALAIAYTASFEKDYS